MLNQTDQERFTCLWINHQSAVFGYLNALVRDRQAAEDLLQETALTALRLFSEYDPQRPFVAWILGIARFKALGYHRDSGRSRMVFDEQMMEHFTENWIELSSGDTKRREALETCLNKLASHSQKVVRMRYYDEMTADQIAKALGGNSGTIRVTLQRIRNELRQCIQRASRQTEGGLS